MLLSEMEPTMTLPPGDYTADQLDAIWVSYQTQGSAPCPRCGAELSLDLESDSAKSHAAPTVSVSCTGCGRQDVFTPGDRNDSEQNPT